MSEEKISKLPNLLNGLAVSYAAADKGNNKAATRAREAAYTEDTAPAQNVQKLLRTLKSGDEKQKPENLLGDPNKKAELTLLADRDGENKRVDNPKGVRFKAEVNKSRKDAPEKRYVELDSGNLNLRSAPGTINSVLDKIPNGTEVGFTGNIKTVDGEKWAEIECSGKKGWVAEEYLITEKNEKIAGNQKPITDMPQSGFSTNEKEVHPNPFDINQIQEEFKKYDDFDGSGSHQCPDFVKWYIDKYTSLNWQRGNGNEQTTNTALNNGLGVTVITSDPDEVTFPALYSVEGYVEELGASGTAEEGHTGIVLGRTKTPEGEDAFLVIHTWNGCDVDGYNTAIKEYKIPRENVTYLNLSPYLK